MSNIIERLIESNRLSPIRDFTMSPFKEFSRDFDRISDFLNLGRTGAQEGSNFLPPCEISEEANAYLMKVDLPGVHKDQVKVEVDGDQLTISAERREEKSPEGKGKYLSEVCYGTYKRSFTLPGPVEEKSVDAKLEEGVLTVKVPKIETAKAKQIPVQ